MRGPRPRKCSPRAGGCGRRRRPVAKAATGKAGAFCVERRPGAGRPASASCGLVRRPYISEGPIMPCAPLHTERRLAADRSDVGMCVGVEAPIDLIRSIHAYICRARLPDWLLQHSVVCARWGESAAAPLLVHIHMIDQTDQKPHTQRQIKENATTLVETPERSAIPLFLSLYIHLLSFSLPLCLPQNYQSTNQPHPRPPLPAAASRGRREGGHARECAAGLEVQFVSQGFHPLVPIEGVGGPVLACVCVCVCCVWGVFGVCVCVCLGLCGDGRDQGRWRGVGG